MQGLLSQKSKAKQGGEGEVAFAERTLVFTHPGAREFFQRLSKKGATDSDFERAKLASQNAKLQALIARLAEENRGASESELLEQTVAAYQKYPAIAEHSTEIQGRLLQQLLSESSFQEQFREAYTAYAEKLNACPKYDDAIPAHFPAFVEKASDLSPQLVDPGRLASLRKAARSSLLTGSHGSLIEESLALWSDFASRLDSEWDRNKVDEKKATASRRALMESFAGRGLLEFAFLSLTVWKSHVAFSQTAEIAKGAPAWDPAYYPVGRRSPHKDGGHMPSIFKKRPTSKMTPGMGKIEQQLLRGIVAGITAMERKRGKGAVGEIFRRNDERHLSEYANSKKMDPFESLVVKHSREKYSIFMTKKQLEAFPLTFGTLGRNDNTMYVALKSQADHLLKVAGKSGPAMAHALGFDLKKYQGEVLCRIDLDFSYSHNPRLPNGKELGRDPVFFQWGGFTSGGLREIVHDQITFSSAKVLGVYEIGRIPI